MSELHRGDEIWGPSHQERRAPRSTCRRNAFAAGLLGVVALELFMHRLLGQGAVGAAGSTLATILRGSLALLAGYLVMRRLLALTTLLRSRRPRGEVQLADRLAGAPKPGGAVRAHLAALGGGCFLGLSLAGRWATADPEHAVLVLGPPRSGKTSAVVIPALLAHAGAAVSTSTKLDVMRATLASRRELGQAWLFDPGGEQGELPSGVRRLRWSPVAAAGGWDEALLIARAMACAAAPGAGTSNESHWRERSSALLAPLLLAANVTRAPIGEVLGWVLRHDLDAPALILSDEDEPVAGDVLLGIARTDARERSSILSATAGVLAAYNSRGARHAAAEPNFEPDRFVAGSDTVYIAAAAHRQALCAPLVVGLLEQIRHAAYARHGREDGGRPTLLCLDELANIAPIHDLPALVSEAGGQGLHVLACLQDLSQARQRWGPDAADGLLSLFQTKLILTGIADARTLENLSLALGEYDRKLVSHTIGRSQSEKVLLPGPGTRSESVSYQTQRQRTLSPGEIARLPRGRALLLRGAGWELVRLAPWHRTEPWRTLAEGPNSSGCADVCLTSSIARRVNVARFGAPVAGP
jgi:type IV secretion system protein VirD4